MFPQCNNSQRSSDDPEQRELRAISKPPSLPAKSQSVTAGLYAGALSSLSATRLVVRVFCLRMCVCECVSGLTLEARLGAIDLFTCAPLTASH